MKSNNWYDNMMKEHHKKLAKDNIKMQKQINKGVRNAIELFNEFQAIKQEQIQKRLPKTWIE